MNSIKTLLARWLESQIEKRIDPSTVRYTLELTPDAQKFIEFLQLPYDERRKRALDLLGDDVVLQAALAQGSGSGLSLQGSTSPDGERGQGVNYIRYGENHIEDLLKLAFPYKDWTKKQAILWEKKKEDIAGSRYDPTHIIGD